MDGARKRVRQDAALSTNGGVAGFKRAREWESQPGLEGKTKPCTKFFSIGGCPFGEGCHFLHYVPGGLKSINFGNPIPTPVRKPIAPMAPVSMPDRLSAPLVKTKLCNKYNTSEGCKFGDTCHFAHGEREIGKPISASYGDRDMGIPKSSLGRAFRQTDPLPASGGVAAAAASFGASATANISVDASLAGAIIGKGGVNTKKICRETGVKLVIKDHETDPSLRNIALEGTFDQIEHASALVRELIMSTSTQVRSNIVPVGPAAPPAGSGGNYKTKPCGNFAKGTCTFGERCHFAHGAHELRRFA